MKNVLKKVPVFFTLLLLSGMTMAQSPIGKWKTVDDETGKVRSIVEIYEQEGKLFGKILELRNRAADEDPDPVCDDCDKDDPRYNQRVVGMVILTDLKKTNDKLWENGKILDPKNGSVYSCYLELKNPDKLKLRGYIGFSLIGRTQFWYRVE
jgi:uncharacterized protein (DUF2147 family)